MCKDEGGDWKLRTDQDKEYFVKPSVQTRPDEVLVPPGTSMDNNNGRGL